MTVQAVVFANTQDQIVLRGVEHIVYTASVCNVVLLSYQLVVVFADQELGYRAIFHANEKLFGALVDAEAGRRSRRNVTDTDHEEKFGHLKSNADLQRVLLPWPVVAGVTLDPDANCPAGLQGMVSKIAARLSEEEELFRNPAGYSLVIAHTQDSFLVIENDRLVYNVLVAFQLVKQ